MMYTETQLTIPLSDGHVAYAKLRGHWAQPLVIFAHGLTGSMDEVLPNELSKFLTQHNFACLRFNFYDWREHARRIGETTLHVHAQDLADIVAYAQAQGSQTIHVIGHSYGGLTLLIAGQLPITSGILLDPAHPKYLPMHEVKFITELDAYLWSEGIDFMLSKAMIEIERRLNLQQVLTAYQLPTLVIAAGAGILQETSNEYYEAIRSRYPARFTTIPAAQHTFHTDEMQQATGDAILAWLKDFPHA